MAPFPIADLPPVLLEKVISQLVKTKGYFRLQQTCRYIAEFCQYSRNIDVRIRRYCKIIWETAEDGGYQLILLVRRDGKEKRLNPEVFHGARFIAAGTPKSIANFNEFCDILRKYRITCTDLSIEGSQVHNDLNLTKEQCTDLVKILKPEVINIHSDESDRFEAVLHAKGLNELNLRLKPEEICHSMSKILKFPKTLLYTLEVGPKTLHEIFELLLSVLQILLLEPLPDSKLYVFHLFLCADAELPSEEQLQKTFHQFDPFVCHIEKNGCQKFAVFYPSLEIGLVKLNLPANSQK